VEYQPRFASFLEFGVKISSDRLLQKSDARSSREQSLVEFARSSLASSDSSDSLEAESEPSIIVEQPQEPPARSGGPASPVGRSARRSDFAYRL
jgi:hypothetical protein